MSEQTKSWLLIVSICFFIAGMILGKVKAPEENADMFAERVQEHFQGMDADIDGLLKDIPTLRNLAYKEPISSSYKDIDFFDKPYTFVIFKNDSLIFWNNVDVGHDITTSDILYEQEPGQLIQLPNGHFYIRGDSIPNLGRMLTFFPVKYEYKLQTLYLKDIFAVDRDLGVTWHSTIPSDLVDVGQPGTGTPILNSKGQEVFSLVAKAPVKMPWISYLLFFLYAVAAVFGLLWLTQVARYVSRTHEPLIGVILLAGVLFVIRILMVHLNAVESFQDVPLFSTRYSTNFFADTIGDMLINTLLSVWVSIFFFKEYKITKDDEETYPKLSSSVFFYSSIIAGILGITFVLRGLVLGTDIPFDFEKIGNLRWTSMVSIISILMLMLMLFLFTYRVSLSVRQLGLNLVNRLACLAVAVALTFTFTLGQGLDITTLVLLLLFSIIYIIAFDLYVEGDSANILWIVAWLVIYSAFSSSFLYKYNQRKEWKQRIAYAKFLTDDRDLSMEERLQELDKEINADGEITQVVAGDLNYDEIEELLMKNHSVDLRFIRYKHNLHVFVQDTFSNISTIGPSEDELLRIYNKTDITLENNLRFKKDKNNLGTYYLKMKYPRNRLLGDVILLFEFTREVGKNTRISTELFINEEFREIEGLEEYEYAIYIDKRLVLENGGDFGDDILNLENIPGKGKYRFEKLDGKSHLIYHAWNGNLAMLDIKIPDFWDKVVSLNSYLFTIMVIVLGVLMIINTLIQLLPFGQEPVFSPIPSLKNKIQVSVIAVIILSFLVIGVATIIYFEQKNDEYHQGRLGRKAKSIRRDTAREIQQGEINDKNLDKFKDIVEPIATIHTMDINIYDLDGRLVESSGKDVYSKGLKSPLMNASAFYELSTLGKNKVTMNMANSEQVGHLIYEAQYETLKDRYGRVIAYIGMPYYSQISIIQDETSDFIGRLLNVYVFLLAIAGVIAIFVANSITSPLSQIGEKLKEVKIGKKNEPLEWTTNDELGALIDEYNKMIKKLEDSTMLLAQSERESAWREMAKQVAHEIKNPLTPMKLSIQYLQHAYHSNPANMESMLKRVSNTLIEQIDNLSHIATEFSNFAKMPRAENERFELNLLVQSVYDLFSEQEEMDMSIMLPSDPVMVFADKNQLMRVFNNLIKNAMQAIPEDRRGAIEVHLRQLDNKLVQLEVKDNGSGISMDMEEFIFVPHITTKSSGTGLGLAISKSIIEALDGSIYFKSEEGVGTSFFVELPISHENDELD